MIDPSWIAASAGAVFDVDGQHFAYVPGGTVTVGYDANRFSPTPEQAEDYAASAAEWGLTEDIRAFVDQMTSPPRTVTLAPMLVAVEARDAGQYAVAPGHPVIAGLVEEDERRRRRTGQPTPGTLTVHGKAKIEFNPDGTVRRAWLKDKPSYDVEVARLAEAGQRLPTPEEWEHACGAGASTLWRWGDTCPLDDDPYAVRTVQYEPHPFGLRIGQDPYRDERTADPGVVCGGDGGSMVCGGAGAFVSWLALATSYRDPNHCAAVRDNTYGPDEMLIRPVIPLPS
ncbi:SUMF1/EgtB/PvdO family nonheme iron enzyme [Actinoplanes sp. CA-054009]